MGAEGVQSADTGDLPLQLLISPASHRPESERESARFGGSQ